MSTTFFLSPFAEPAAIALPNHSPAGPQLSSSAYAQPRYPRASKSASSSVAHIESWSTALFISRW